MPNTTPVLGIPYPLDADAQSAFPAVAAQAAALIEAAIVTDWRPLGDIASIRREGRRAALKGELGVSVPNGGTYTVPSITVPTDLRPARTCGITAAGFASGGSPQHGRNVTIRIDAATGQIQVINAWSSTITGVHLEGITWELD